MKNARPKKGILIAVAVFLEEKGAGNGSAKVAVKGSDLEDSSRAEQRERTLLKKTRAYNSGATSIDTRGLLSRLRVACLEERKSNQLQGEAKEKVKRAELSRIIYGLLGEIRRGLPRGGGNADPAEGHGKEYGLKKIQKGKRESRVGDHRAAGVAKQLEETKNWGLSQVNTRKRSLYLQKR